MNGLLKDLRRLWDVYRGRPFPRPEEKTLPVTAVIMGAQVLRGGRPSSALEARVEHAARMYSRGDLKLLVPTGGLGEHAPREAALMADILRREGVPEKAVSLENKATSTWDSASRLAGIVRERGLEDVLVVTDPLHCVRSVWAFREFGIQAWAEPAYGSPMWWKPRSRRAQLVREAAALVWYRIRYRAYKAGSHSRR